MMFESIRAQYFPIQLAAGSSAQSITDRTAYWQIIGPLMDSVFPNFNVSGVYVMPEEHESRSQELSEAFANAHHERFVIVNEKDEPIGWSFGDMRDRATFFMTSSGLLPAYRQRGIYSAFTRHLLAYLYVIGYERVLSNHQTNNRAIIIAKLKLGFNITAVNLDERWGAQVELTYHFTEARRRGYEHAFALEPRDTPVSHL